MMSRILFFFLLIFLNSNYSFGQRVYGGTPSLKQYLKYEVPTTSIASLNVQSLLKNDQLEGISNRVARDINVDINVLENAFIHKKESGQKLVYSRIKIPKALGFSLLIDHLKIPKGAMLFFISANRENYHGAYTSDSFSDRLYIDFLKGEEIMIELLLPADSNVEDCELHISKLFQVYKPEMIGWNNTAIERDIGFGTSFECHINAACSEGNEIRDEIKSVVRIQMVYEEGVGYCTGGFLNNTSNDNTPYLMTADHCIHNFTPLYDQWRFDYKYESESCEQPNVEPNYLSSIGCEFLASNYESDFLLVKLYNNLPISAEVFLAGWNRNVDYYPSNCILIEHPNADIKKLAKENDKIKINPFVTHWNGGVPTPANSHFYLYFDEGTQQPGASGGPLIDPNGSVIGQLHGGVGLDSTCSVTRIDYFGMLNYSWDNSDTIDQQLAYWLDPLLTNENIIIGKFYEYQNSIISGNVSTYMDRVVDNVLVEVVSDDDTFFTYTDANGNFELEYSGENAIINFSKIGNPRNGLNIVDIIKLTQHILLLSLFNDEVKEYIADVNDSSSLNIVDIIFIRKLILKIDDHFPSNKSWVFYGNDLPVESGMHIEIKAAKFGDVNFSVDPTKE